MLVLHLLQLFGLSGAQIAIKNRVSNGAQRTKVAMRSDLVRQDERSEDEDAVPEIRKDGKERGGKGKKKKREQEKRRTHIPLEHDFPPLDLFVPQSRPFLQLLPRLAPPRRRVARKHRRLTEVGRLEDEDRSGVVACRETGGGGRGRARCGGL